ncbi:MAG: hypothetical protein K6G26_08010 [Lachnospiraceae bacterium]|nr:hypothetical protein [Lachnospiraceae bacterium]
MLSISSGLITGLCDALFIKKISLENAHELGKEKAENMVMKLAKKKGYKGKGLSGAIKKLEEDYPMASDKLTNDFGGGYNHHLRDFSATKIKDFSLSELYFSKK